MIHGIDIITMLIRKSGYFFVVYFIITIKDFIMDIIKLQAILDAGHVEGKKAYDDHISNNKSFGGCGFAWSVISQYEGKKIMGSNKMGKMLKKCGIDQNSYREFYVWDRNPSQSVDAKMAYQEAFSKHLRDNGFRCYPDSRLD